MNRVPELGTVNESVIVLYTSMRMLLRTTENMRWAQKNFVLVLTVFELSRSFHASCETVVGDGGEMRSEL